MRPTRAEISIDSFVSNLRFIRDRVGERTKIMAIVKANAYGHGLEIIANAALESTLVHAFGVATEEEGVRLRKLTSRPILVLTTALEEEIDVFLEHDLEFTLVDRTMLDAITERARALGKKAKVHVKVDTGMRRIGLEPENALDFMRTVSSCCDTVELVGLSTHYATSDELDHRFFDKQIATFNHVVRQVKDAGIEVPLIHTANSGAILQKPKETAFDMVRPGIMLYGYAPSQELDEMYRHQLRPPLELSSCIVYKKRVKCGEGVSYNLRWKCERDTTIVTVPYGYGDGYPRLLTNRTCAIVHGKAYNVVGTICMDQVMIDVGDDDVSIGDKAVFISRDPNSFSAWHLARTIGTIPYEILTSIAARVPRLKEVE
jgi:alanine racemase